jgi:hypothetical protein
MNVYDNHCGLYLHSKLPLGGSSFPSLILHSTLMDSLSTVHVPRMHQRPQALQARRQRPQPSLPSQQQGHPTAPTRRCDTAAV